MTKSEIRASYLDKRRSLSGAMVQEMSRKIADRFFTSFDLDAVTTFHCFVSIAKFNEVDTSSIFSTIWKQFPAVRTAAPRIVPARGVMRNLLYTANSELLENPWGIREPASGDAVEPIEIDMVLVPGLAFDQHGHRVGYGRGYYDRFLNNCRADCIKIGLSFFDPVDEIRDVHAGDVRLDFCITPGSVFATKQN